MLERFTNYKAKTTDCDGMEVSYQDRVKIVKAVNDLLDLGETEYGDVLDPTAFITRLETSRDITMHTTKKDRSTPSLLFMPDFSGSCISYARVFNTYMKSIIGIQEDYNIIVAPTFDGLPQKFYINGKEKEEVIKYYGKDYVENDEGDCLDGDTTETPTAASHYIKEMSKLVSAYNITIAIVCGDFQGAWMYSVLCNTDVNRVLWLDGSVGNIGKAFLPNDVVEALPKSSARVHKEKLTYVGGVKTVDEFVRTLQRVCR